MSHEHPIISILSGHGIKVRPYPESVKEPGFYLNNGELQIEHWSKPCEWNMPFQDHAMNAEGLVLDGFQGVAHLEDADHLVALIGNWKESLSKHLETVE